MQIDGAIVKEQGVTFTIVIVKQHVIQSPITADDARASFTTLSTSSRSSTLRKFLGSVTRFRSLEHLGTGLHNAERGCSGIRLKSDDNVVAITEVECENRPGHDVPPDWCMGNHDGNPPT